MPRKPPNEPGNRRMVTCRPTHVQLLLDGAMTVVELAKELGLAPSVIHDAIRTNEIRLAYDLAAKSILQDRTRPVSEEMNQGKPLGLNTLLAELKWHFEEKTVFDLTEQEVKILNQPLRQILKERDNNERKVY